MAATSSGVPGGARTGPALRGVAEQIRREEATERLLAGVVNTCLREDVLMLAPEVEAEERLDLATNRPGSVHSNQSRHAPRGFRSLLDTGFGPRGDWRYRLRHLPDLLDVR